MSEVQGQGQIVYPVSNSTSFRFTSIGPTIPGIWPKEGLTSKNTSENSPKDKRFQQNFSKI